MAPFEPEIERSEHQQRDDELDPEVVGVPVSAFGRNTSCVPPTAPNTLIPVCREVMGSIRAASRFAPTSSANVSWITPYRAFRAIPPRNAARASQ